MNRQRTRQVPLPVAFFVLLVGLVGCANDDAGARSSAPPEEAVQAAETPRPAVPTAGPRSYQKAPDFSLPSVSGGTIDLSSYRGKVILVDFWATWCGPCRASIPHLNELYLENRQAGFEIIGISLDQGRRGQSGLELVRKFATKTRMNYPLAMGSAAVVTAYGGIRSIPTAFLIDRDGLVRKKYVGMQPKRVFEKDIKELLAKKPSSEEEELI